MDEHDVMADAFRFVLSENRYAFHKTGRYLNEYGRPGYRWVAEVNGETIYLVESNTPTGRSIDTIVSLVNKSEIDRSKSVAYFNRYWGEGRRIEFWCDGIWIHMFWPNVN